VVRDDGIASEIGCENLAAAGALFGEIGTENTLSYSIDSADFEYQLVLIAPGTYTVTVEGEVDNSVPIQRLESSYTLSLLDPCDPPTSITAATLFNQVYTITDDDATYTHPIFTVDPSYCPLYYSYTIGDITNISGESAITLVDKTFFFDYSLDLEPLGES
jgi:hypothetical protein